MLIDLHTHTSFSPDSSEPFEKMLKKAAETCLSFYCVTDHCEAKRFFSAEHYNKIPSGLEADIYNYDECFYSSVNAVTEAKQKSRRNVELLCGVELGEALYDLEASEIIINDKRLDFIIGSLHELENLDDFAFLDYRNYDVPKLLETYFTEIYRHCVWGKFDVLGHLTYPLRYIEGEFGISVPLSPYEEIIRESFKELIQKGKGIELNTSGLRQKYGKTFPTKEYLMMFKELGGEILTIGSDAHCTEDLAKGIPDGIKLAQQCGFRYLAYFFERTPKFVKI